MIDPDMNAQRGGKSNVQVTSDSPSEGSSLDARARRHGRGLLFRIRSRRLPGGVDGYGNAHGDEGERNRDFGWFRRRRNRARDSGGVGYAAGRDHHHPEGGRTHQTVHLGPGATRRGRIKIILACLVFAACGVIAGEYKDRGSVKVDRILAVLPPGCHYPKCAVLKPLMQTRIVYVRKGK